MSKDVEEGPSSGHVVATPEGIVELARQLGEALSKNDGRLALAESCTGGGVAAAVTEVPGASAWFEGGYVVYANEAKQRDLGVSASLIAQAGAVSGAVVRAMVAGLLDRTPASIGAAISGVAGPDGGSADKPVGTVWFGFGLKSSGRLLSECQHFSGSRHEVRLQAVAYCLRRLVELSKS